MVHRASEVSKFNNADSPAAQARAGQFAQEFKKEVESQNQQVNNPNNPEKTEVNKDGRGGATYKRNQKDGKKQDDSEKDKKDKPMFKEHSRFSMKV
jgi:hypothetical protein